MPFRFFTIPVSCPESGEGELNRFLGSHRVLNVERRWVDQGPSSFWSFCVDYLDAAAGAASKRDFGSQRAKVDYKELLSPEDFALFARLRDFRKQLAQAEAVPVYTIFTNEQLAQIVQRRATSKQSLAEIVGVGDARVAKYGDRLMEFLAGSGPKETPP
jgi:superfamily II DNA helicase RecQ